MEDLRDIILAENEFIWNYDPGQPRDAQGKWTAGGGGVTFVERKATGRLTAEEIKEYVRGKYPGKPKVVGYEEYDYLDGEEIFRGVDNEQQARDYVNTNKHFSTNEQAGIYGHDFSIDYEIARANRSGEAKKSGECVVIQAKIDTTHQVDKNQLVKERNYYCPEQDLTTFAVDKGYSSIIDNISGTVIVLDKTATTVFDNSLKSYPDEYFNHLNKSRGKDMDRLETLNKLENVWLNTFNPAQPRDKLGRWCSMGVWVTFSKETGLGNPYEVSGINGGMTKASIVGVAGDSIPDTLPRIKNLSKEQKQIQEEFDKKWEDKKEREKALKELETMKPFNSGTVETDAIKQLDPKWGKDDRIKEIQESIKKGEASKEMVNELDGYMKYRQENNTILHQAANALAKEYFKRQVEANPKAEILVTSGGCGSGKGYFLESTDAIGQKADRPWGQIEIKDKTNGFAKTHMDSVLNNKNTITWDAAGDQNSAELNWLKSFDRKMTVVHTVGDPNKNAAAAGSGLTDRALTKGRMVDATVYAQSYTIGNQNTKSFYQANADNPKITFLKVENNGKGGDVIVMKFDTPSKLDNVSISPSQAQKIIDKGLKSLNNVSQSTKDSIKLGAEFVDSLQK